MVSNQSRTWSILAHLAGLLPSPLSLLSAILIWQIKGRENSFDEQNGKESVNFQICILIYATVAGLLTVVLIGIPLLIALGIFNLVCVIIATVKASNGELYRYPLNLRLIK